MGKVGRGGMVETLHSTTFSTKFSVILQPLTGKNEQKKKTSALEKKSDKERWREKLNQAGHRAPPSLSASTNKIKV